MAALRFTIKTRLSLRKKSLEENFDINFLPSKIMNRVSVRMYNSERHQIKIQYSIFIHLTEYDTIR